jgi:DNA helicase-2/ATP-dependent DNA helicase PcrA
LNLARQAGTELGQETLFKSYPVTQKEEKNSKSGIEEFLELIQNSREELLGGGELSKKVRKLIDKIDYWSHLVNEHSKDEKKARWKFTNIEYLIRMIEDWEKDPDNLDNGLYAYLNRVSLLTRTDSEEEAGRGKVNLMTIHAAKGLEFPVVFIAGAEEGIIPHERSLEDIGNKEPMEEERRLFYVAITRARDRLYITSCQKRRKLKALTERSPSPFLLELPPHLIEYREEDQEDNTIDEEAFFKLMRERFG